LSREQRLKRILDEIKNLKPEEDQGEEGKEHGARGERTPKEGSEDGPYEDDDQEDPYQKPLPKITEEKNIATEALKASKELALIMSQLADKINKPKSPEPPEKKKGPVDIGKLTSSHLQEYPVLGDEDGVQRWALGFLNLVRPLALSDAEKEQVLATKLSVRASNVWRLIDGAIPFKEKIYSLISHLTGRALLSIREEQDPDMITHKENETGASFIDKLLATDFTTGKSEYDLVVALQAKLHVLYRARLQHINGIVTLERLQYEVARLDETFFTAKKSVTASR